STAKSIPPIVDLSLPPVLKTDNPSDGSTSQEQHGAGAGGGEPTFKCECPKVKGWTPEELEAHRLRTNLTGGYKQCFCSSKDKNEHWIIPWLPSVHGESCLCPSVNGWSLNELQMHNTISNIKGTKDECFCSLFDPDIFKEVNTTQDLIPHGPVAENCTCPAQSWWTEDELIEIERVTDLRLPGSECYCVNEYGYSIRQKVKSNDNHEEVSEDGDVSTVSSTGRNTKLRLLEINGPLKEFHLGSLLIKFAK
ncbi:hypothetical protein C0J52_03276, partial [Blattella germanica]